jgi:hypothetical protein
MPLEEALRNEVLGYCARDLPPDSNVSALFDFIDDEKLRERVEAEFKAARYIYKLGEALNVSDERLHAHVKFQIVQYAGIYEAIIVHLLWGRFSQRLEVTDIEYHNTLRKVAAMPSNIRMSTIDSEDVFLSVERRERTPPISIKFDDKVDAAVAIGFVDGDIGEEIKSFYKLRNAIHLESAIKNQITYELTNSLLAYRRMLPFTAGVRGFLRDGVLPADARPKPVATSLSTGSVPTEPAAPPQIPYKQTSQ